MEVQPNSNDQPLQTSELSTERHVESTAEEEAVNYDSMEHKDEEDIMKDSTEQNVEGTDREHDNRDTDSNNGNNNGCV
jgi:hypothetical protein